MCVCIHVDNSCAGIHKYILRTENTMFCYACQIFRDQVEHLLDAPWEYLVSHYEFMIVFASFQRNITFYSNVDRGQLKLLYSQLVSFSPARILIVDRLITLYTKQVDSDAVEVPRDLSRIVTLALGNVIPDRFIHNCISRCTWNSYDTMILATSASVENIRGGPLKYLAIIKSYGNVHRIDHIRIVIALAITGWMSRFSDLNCTCGTWIQALDMVSCSVPDTETTLTVQDDARLCSYICTLLDIKPRPTWNATPLRSEQQDVIDYGHVFSDLLVSGLDK